MLPSSSLMGVPSEDLSRFCSRVEEWFGLWENILLKGCAWGVLKSLGIMLVRTPLTAVY